MGDDPNGATPMTLTRDELSRLLEDAFYRAYERGREHGRKEAEYEVERHRMRRVHANDTTQSLLRDAERHIATRPSAPTAGAGTPATEDR